MTECGSMAHTKARIEKKIKKARPKSKQEDTQGSSYACYGPALETVTET